MRVAILAALAGLTALGSAQFCWAHPKPPCICPPIDLCHLRCDDPNQEPFCACVHVYCECQCVTQMRGLNRSTTPEQDLTIRTKMRRIERDLSPATLTQEEYLSAKQPTNTDALQESPLSVVARYSSSAGLLEPIVLEPIVLEAEADVDVQGRSNEVAVTTQSSSAQAPSSSYSSSSSKVYTTISVTIQSIAGYCNGELKCFSVNYPKNCYCFWTEKPAGVDGQEVQMVALMTPIPTPGLAARSDGGTEITTLEPVPSFVGRPGASAEKLIIRRNDMDHMCSNNGSMVCEGNEKEGFKCTCKKEDKKEDAKQQESEVKTSVQYVYPDGRTAEPPSTTEAEQQQRESEVERSTLYRYPDGQTAEPPKPTEAAKGTTAEMATLTLYTTPSAAEGAESSQAQAYSTVVTPLAGIPLPPLPPDEPAATSPTTHTTMSHEDYTYKPYIAPDPKTVRYNSEEAKILHFLATSTFYPWTGQWAGAPRCDYNTKYPLVTTWRQSDPQHPKRGPVAEATAVPVVGDVRMMTARKGKKLVRVIKGVMRVERVVVKTAVGSVGGGGGGSVGSEVGALSGLPAVMDSPMDEEASGLGASVTEKKIEWDRVEV